MFPAPWPRGPAAPRPYGAMAPRPYGAMAPRPYGAMAPWPCGHAPAPTPAAPCMWTSHSMLD